MLHFVISRNQRRRILRSTSTIRPASKRCNLPDTPSVGIRYFVARRPSNPRSLLARWACQRFLGSSSSGAIASNQRPCDCRMLGWSVVSPTMLIKSGANRSGGQANGRPALIFQNVLQAAQFFPSAAPPPQTHNWVPAPAFRLVNKLAYGAYL